MIVALFVLVYFFWGLSSFPIPMKSFHFILIFFLVGGVTYQNVPHLSHHFRNGSRHDQVLMTQSSFFCLNVHSSTNYDPTTTAALHVGRLPCANQHAHRARPRLR